MIVVLIVVVVVVVAVVVVVVVVAEVGVSSRKCVVGAVGVGVDHL